MVVSIMPCTAKKGEILRPDNFTDGRQDTDYVITTTEVVRMIKQMGLQFTELEMNLQMHHFPWLPEQARSSERQVV